MTSFEQSNSKAKGNKRQPFIQAKLTIGQPNDQYEQEADRVAEQVMRMPESEAPVQRICEECEEPAVAKAMADGESLQMKPLAEGITPVVQRQASAFAEASADGEEETLQMKREPGILQKQSEEEEELVQTKSADSGAMSASTALESRLNSKKGQGQPLPESARQSMSQVFGTDFSGVKVHTDNESVQMNRELGAKAFTHGSDIYFNAGEYSPESGEGKRLLGHELTHVVQQGKEEMCRVSQTTRNIQRKIEKPTDDKGNIISQNHKKIIIEPIPDFLSSDVDAVNKKIKVSIGERANITKVDWHLFDPREESIQGSHDFSIEQFYPFHPMLFSLEGRYVLRCIGYDNAGTAVAFADRNFNVFKSDSDQGDSPYGEFIFEEYRILPKEENRLMEVKIKFIPKESISNSKQIGFIQNVRVLNEIGRAKFGGGEMNDRKTKSDWTIDRFQEEYSPFFGAISELQGGDNNIRMPVTNSKGEPAYFSFGKGGAIPQPAKMHDRPNVIGVLSFETCAIARDTGEVFGCVTWGYSASSEEDVKLMPRGYHSKPSQYFQEAADYWNKWAKNRETLKDKRELIPELKDL